MDDWQETLPMILAGLPTVEEYAEKWAHAHQSQEWLDAMLTLLRAPPPEVKQDGQKNETLLWVLAILLADWLKQDRDAALPKIAFLLDDKLYRCAVLEAISSVSSVGNASWIIPLLYPLAQVSEELDEEEIILLISALGDTHSPEALAVLRSMRVPEVMTAARHDLGLYLDKRKITDRDDEVLG